MGQAPASYADGDGMSLGRYPGEMMLFPAPAVMVRAATVAQPPQGGSGGGEARGGSADTMVTYVAVTQPHEYPSPLQPLPPPPLPPSRFEAREAPHDKL